MMSKRQLTIEVASEVRDALARGTPIVALESTIISHGMPYPRNLQVALELEQIVRQNGAIPATIAVIHGVPRVGLSHDQLELLAKEQRIVLKASTRDLSVVCSQKSHAATTVASTMRIAHLVNIPIFATGGIGGVHRGAELTMDISADLIELSRTPVTVICAGIKSILDIPKSLEVLETQGVPVLGYKTDEFPAFFTNKSGVKTPARIDSAREAAQVIVSRYFPCYSCHLLIFFTLDNVQSKSSMPFDWVSDRSAQSSSCQ